jgi:hypothetical protein
VILTRVTMVRARLAAGCCSPHSFSVIAIAHSSILIALSTHCLPAQRGNRSSKYFKSGYLPYKAICFFSSFLPFACFPTYLFIWSCVDPVSVIRRP